MATATADLQHHWKEIRVEIRNQALCALEKLAEQAFRELGIIRKRFYESQFLHLLIHRETLLKTVSALANKKNTKSQKRVTMVQTSKEITRWHNGYKFRLVFALLTSWIFWDASGLDATGHYQNGICWQPVTTILLFINLGNSLPGYKSLKLRSLWGFRVFLCPPFLPRWLSGKEFASNAGLGQEDPLKEEMATHSSILAWKMPWTEESNGLESMGSQRVGYNWVTEHTQLFIRNCTSRNWPFWDSHNVQNNIQ